MAGTGTISLAIEVVSERRPQVSRGVVVNGKAAAAAQVPGRSQPSAELADFVGWAVRHAPGKRYALLVMGHGGGLLGGGALPPAALSPAALTEGLRRATAALGRPLDLVALDTCYAGTLEVAYALRGLCRYVTAAPGLIYSPGLDWGGSLRAAAADAADGALARELVRRGMQRHERPVALVALDLAQVENVVAALAALNERLTPALHTEGPVLTYARAHCGSWGEREELADLGPLARILAAEAGSPEVREAAGAVVRALQLLVSAQWRAPEAPPDSGSGVGVYFPPTLETLPEGYAASFDFASACRWAELLESYWGRLFGALPEPARL